MYRPPAFREDRPEILRELIRSYPLGTLVTVASGRPEVSLIPFLLVEGGEHGVLQAHLARANDQVAQLRSASEAMALFHGPQGYVSPSWYPGKAVHHKAVPTWNYAVVQVRGAPRLVDDPAWLRAHLESLTASQESLLPQPWSLDDAPADYLATMQKAIVGLEITVDEIAGKWKMSQNRPEADRRGVEDGLRGAGRDEALIGMVARRDS